MPSVSSTQWIIREMSADDLEAVLELERSAHPHPWSVEQFRRELANPAAHIALMEHDGDVAGFLCWWLVAGEAEIHNVVTASFFQRRGIARRLLEHVLAAAVAAGANRALLEVRVGNAAAIALYRAFGFTDCGIRRRYYANGEDALLMEKYFVRPSGQEPA